MTDRTVLIVDDEPTVRFGIRKFLERRGFRVREAATCDEASRLMDERAPSAAIFDHHLPDGTALDLLDCVRRLHEAPRVIVLTAHGTIDLAVEAMKRGAANFLTKPVELETLATLLEATPESEDGGGPPEARQGARKGRESAAAGGLDPFIGDSAAIRTLAQRARKVSTSELPVLILGETGAGKGVLARWLHGHSGRRKGPFVDLNCGGLNRELLESELFGYRAGAFTGARDDKPGLLEEADGGTVFLDEIGDADLRVQTKLLKVLEERRVRRLGDVRERSIDFRLVAATHWDLPERIRAGSFRKDLYYRISILPLTIPPLRERLADLPLLATTILDRVAPGRAHELHPAALERLQSHPWPGNLRELRNVLERAALLAEDQLITSDDIHLDPLLDTSPPDPDRDRAATARRPDDPQPQPGGLTLEESEIHHIRQALRETGGNVSRAARRLNVPRSSLYEKLRRYGIRPQSER